MAFCEVIVLRATSSPNTKTVRFDSEPDQYFNSKTKVLQLVGRIDGNEQTIEVDNAVGKGEVRNRVG